jgi:hypothetical protein
MPFPVISVIIFIFIIWLQYEIRKTARKSKRDSDTFWDREIQANQARRKDISNLEYIKISSDTLPLDDKADDTINSYRDTILKLKDKKILKLTGISNTELKNDYGVANINLLTEYDNNYAILVSMLQKWAERLYSKGFTKDAQAVLEYALSCQTDVNKTYKLLADIYKSQNTPEKIDQLIQIVTGITMHDKEKLLQDLHETKSS